MEKSRILEILLNYVDYCEELKKRDSAEDKKIFYFDVIGLDEEELKFFDIEIEE